MNKDPNNTSKCPICGRPTHKESKYCIFHASAEEKTEEEFKKALKEYFEEIEKENKGYNFKDFIFIGYIDFTNIVFKNKYVSFWGTTFEGMQIFQEQFLLVVPSFLIQPSMEMLNLLAQTFRDMLTLGEQHLMEILIFIVQHLKELLTLKKPLLKRVLTLQR